jgi:hypothetical protein
LYAQAPTTSAIFSLDFILLQDFRPEPLGLEKQLNDLADRSLAAGGGGDVVRALLDFGARVGRGDGETDAAEQDHVGEVVADESDFLGGNAGVLHDLFEDGDLLGVALVDVLELALAGALGGGGRLAPADEAGGSWKVLRDTWNSDLPLPAPEKPATTAKKLTKEQ